MKVAHKIQLLPNKTQAAYFKQCCMVHRVAYNWALGEWRQLAPLNAARGDKMRLNKRITRAKDDGVKARLIHECREIDDTIKRLNAIDHKDHSPSRESLAKEFRTIRGAKYPFWNQNQVFANVHVGAMRHIQEAMSKYRKEGKGYPRFKRPDRDDTSFYMSYNDMCLDKDNRFKDKYLQVPKLGKVKMREWPRWDGKLVSATVSKYNNRWWVSLAYEIEQPPYRTNGAMDIIGVDMNLGTIDLSNGDKIKVPRKLEKLEQRKTILQRRLRPPRKGKHRGLTQNSNEWEKTVRQLQRVEARIKNIRRDYQHKLTGRLARQCARVGIEDISPQFMLKNPRQARAAANVGIHELQRQFEYKCEWSGTYLVRIDQRKYPSTQTCSKCGYVRTGDEKLTIKDREVYCPKCHYRQDRDLNAAINLENWARLAPSPEPGDDGGGLSKKGQRARKGPAKPSGQRDATTHKPKVEQVE